MCNVKDDGEAEMVTRLSIARQGGTCVKCKKAAVLITRVNDAFCRECFVFYLTHKFRAEVGKSKLVRDGERVLVAVSGGPASSCLLRLIKEGLSERAHKRLRFLPAVVYIDESGVVDVSDAESTTTREAMMRKLKESGFPAYTSFLYQGLELEKEGVEPLYQTLGERDSLPCGHSDGIKLLQQVLSSLSSTTAKEELIRITRLRLLAGLARREGYGKVMLGDTSTRIAVRILSDLAQGRGAQVAADAAFADKKNPDIMFLRPLRNINSKEVALYNHLHSVETVFTPTLTTMASEGASIEHQTEGFIAGLQANYVTTVSNICRTGGKMLQMERMDEDDCCSFCQSPLDTRVGQASALVATELSAQLGKPSCEAPGAGSHLEPSTGCHGDGKPLPGFLSEDVRAIKESLCYGCRLILKDMRDVSLFPSQRALQTGLRVTRAQMKEQIQDLLIDDEDNDVNKETSSS